jgi:hypothetical protein
MKLSTGAAVALAALLALLAPGPSGAQPQQGAKTFQLAFCNVSRARPVYIAITRRKDGERWAVEGWYPLLDFGCSIIGNFEADTVYFYAIGIRNNQYVTWGGAENDETAATQCIDRNKAFGGFIAAAPGCPAGQTSVRFLRLKVPQDAPRYTFTLRD